MTTNNIKPISQPDDATLRMLASFAKIRAKREASIELFLKTQDEIDAEELALFDANEARQINTETMR